MIVFVLINVILMLNFVVAILADTFAKYDNIQLGLYYNVLNNKFPSYEWHPHYGALVCSKIPTPTFILTVPFLPLFVLITSEEYLSILNTFVYQVLYLPLSIVMQTFFFLFNCTIIPIAFIVNSLRLIKKVLIANTYAAFG